ncbi:uncharacterized protein RJT21DRAFT_138525 [Scheffersomyces amazonensis]|uniref:uncharacterized protein n=1 Tax=Scheffersomyces amazonensis TaxID=1078765 RepID=UPI00315DF09A
MSRRISTSNSTLKDNKSLGAPFQPEVRHEHKLSSSSFSSNYSPITPDVKFTHSPRISLHSPKFTRYSPSSYKNVPSSERLPSPTLKLTDDNSISDQPELLKDTHISIPNEIIMPSKVNEPSTPRISLVFPSRDQQQHLIKLATANKRNGFQYPPSPESTEESPQSSSQSSRDSFVSADDTAIEEPTTAISKPDQLNNNNNFAASKLKQTFSENNESPTTPSTLSFPIDTHEDETPVLSNTKEFLNNSKSVKTPNNQLVNVHSYAGSNSDGKVITNINSATLKESENLRHITTTPNIHDVSSEDESNSPSETVLSRSSIISRANSLKDKLKRFSSGVVSTSSTKLSDFQTLVRVKSNTISRRSSLSSLRRSSFTEIRSVINNTFNNSQHESTSDSSSLKSTSEPIRVNTISNIPANFWKYHITKHGKDFYVSTNPTLKHIHCRSAPSFFVEVIQPESRSKQSAAKKGFTLVFKSLQQSSTSLNMVITKRDEQEGDHYTIAVPLLTPSSAPVSPHIGSLNSSPISKPKSLSTPKSNSLLGSLYSPVQSNGNSNGHSMKSVVFNGLALPKQLSTNVPSWFKNYEFKDLANNRWNVGSVLDGHDNKSNLYFHKTYIEKILGNQLVPSHTVSYPREESPKNASTIGVFRPNQKRKLKLSSLYIGKPKVLSFHDILNHDKKIQSAIQDTSKANGHTMGKLFNPSILDDGLHHSISVDDEPTENKFGWITVYDNNELIKDSGSDNRDVLNMVMGLLFATAFENSLTL